jgi:hypothetical protein
MDKYFNWAIQLVTLIIRVVELLLKNRKQDKKK